MTQLDTLKSTVRELPPQEQVAFMGWMLQQSQPLFLAQPHLDLAPMRLWLAIKLYESGELTTGLAAKLAGVSRTEFFLRLSEHNLSPFGVDPEELAQDLAHAEQAGLYLAPKLVNESLVLANEI